jgi:hypothetical protein
MRSQGFQIIGEKFKNSIFEQFSFYAVQNDESYVIRPTHYPEKPEEVPSGK